MYVELHIDSRVKRHWYFDDPKIIDALNQASYEVRKEWWKQITLECKVDAGSLIYESRRFEMHIRVRARVQPKDISDEEYQEFINHQNINDEEVNETTGPGAGHNPGEGENAGT